MRNPGGGEGADRAPSWCARGALVLAGLVVLLASTASTILLCLWTIASRSWLWGFGGMAALGACSGGGFQLLRRGLRFAAPREEIPPRPVSLLQVVVTVVVGGVTCLGLLLLGVRDAGGFERLMLHRTGHIALFGWYLLLLLGLIPVVVVIHELGHLAAGALVGFRFQCLQVGPVAVMRDREGLRLRWNQPLPDDVLGQQSSAPEGERSLAWRLIAHRAGGAASNLVTAVLALVVAEAIGRPGSAGMAAFLDAVKMAGVISVLGVANLIPRRRKDVLSDGAQILFLLRARGRARG